MRIGPDDALKNLSNFISKQWATLSEADTRSKIIDPLFTQCLNWQEIDFFREEHSDTGYLDYIFKISGKNTFVVEAKNIGYSFKIPTSFSFKRRYKIGSIISKDKSVRDALLQTQAYCYAKGTRFGVITNGTQYIIFEAYRPGEDWENANCVIFYNLDDISRNFIDFWNILSKDAVERNSLVDTVSMDVEELKFYRPIDDVVFKNVRQPRNEMSHQMAPIIDYAFQEITDPDKIEMLRRCYVYGKEFETVDKSLKSFFSADMPPRYKELDLKKIIQDGQTAGEFQKELEKLSRLSNGSLQEPIVVLLLGGIGCGKTTFIHRFFSVVLTDKEREKRVWLYVNFRDAPLSEDRIKQYILESMLGDFQSKYKTLSEHLRTNLKYEITSVTFDNVEKLVAILKALGYAIYVVIDNVDQHISSSPTFHERVFLETNNLTKSLRTVTILTLREESFYRSDMVGAFDAYYIQKYIISPPNFLELIRYRLDYALEKLALPEGEFKKVIGTVVDFGAKYTVIRDFLKIIRDSLSPGSDEAVSMFSASAFMLKTSGGDMRKALNLFARFLISGNTKIDEMIDIYRYQGSYTIAYHHFIKSIILGDYKYFTAPYSYLMNLFDFNMEFQNSHFLNLRILAYANDHLGNESDIGRGYVSINNLNKEASDVRISLDAIADSLVKLARYGLIVLDTRARDSLKNASYFKITECGHYYLHFLVDRFAYLDLMWMDAPIADVDLVKDLRSHINDVDLDNRFDRTKKFLDYLTRMEEKELTMNPEYQGSKLCKYRFMGRIMQNFEKDKKYILDRIPKKKQ